jgi:hypothetical protein
VDALAETITAQVMDRLAIRLEAAVPHPAVQPPHLRHNGHAHHTPRPHLPSILVAGLKPDQYPPILAAFSSVADISFWNTDEAWVNLRDRTKSADVVFLVTKFLSHSHTQMVEAKAKRTVSLSGAGSMLMNRIREYLAEVRPAAAGDAGAVQASH